MKYSVSPEVFALDSRLRFGIIIGKNIKNRLSSSEDEGRLRKAEEKVRTRIKPETLRDVSNIALYRETMMKAGINPNRFPVSVEAMLKRVLKGDQLPMINALVDLCNAVSLENFITLGAHDLGDIKEDLAVRFSTGEEKFLPFGQTEEETVEKGELVFTSGDQVQTRKWIWRQSELGKSTLDSHHIIFQLVGMADDSEDSLVKAMTAISEMVIFDFGGSCTSYLVSPENMEIEFDNTIKWEDGLYTGELHNGVPHGRGHLKRSNGDWFSGDFQFGFMHGQGEYHWLEGDVYEGAFKDDLPDSRGSIRWKHGAFYEGNWKLGRRCGKGTFKSPGGYCYDGEFLDNWFHGEGTYIWPDGAVESGIWREGILVKPRIILNEHIHFETENEKDKANEKDSKKQ